MPTVLRLPLVAFGYVVERLRHLPIAGTVLRHTSLAAAGLIVVASLAFMVWAGTVAPQRVTLADLVVGNLSHMQTWIIVSGDLSAGAEATVGHRYVLTDPNVPNAIMNVVSDVQLQLGPATVSGNYTGGREPVPLIDLEAGYKWIGTMRADAVLATEPGPPWVPVGLVTAAVLLIIAARVSYPMFFDQRPRSAQPRPMTLPVRVRRGPLTAARTPVTGELMLAPGEPVGLRVADGETRRLRLHSVHTGVDVGELAHLTNSQPALQIRLATDELTLSFASAGERDAALAALIADADQGSRAAASQSAGLARGEVG